VKACTVTINQSASTTLARRCFDFELPVLGEIHGHGNVAVVSEDGAEPMGAEEAMAHLVRRYRDERLIRAVYRDTNDLAAKSGLKLTGETPVEHRSVQIVEAAPKAGKKAA